MKIDSRIRKELMRRASKDTHALRMWRAYITFLEACPRLAEHTPGTAIHHILWRAEYPQFKKCRWNLIRLRHADHTAASALMLGAEPHNAKLSAGFHICSKILSIPFNTWVPTEIQTREIVRLYREGWIPRHIGEKFGRSEAPIIRILKSNGVKIRGISEAIRWNPSESQAKRIVRLYKAGLSTTLIGKNFGFVGPVISRVLKGRGVKVRGDGPTPWAPTDPQTNEIIRLYRNKRTPKHIGKKFGFGSHTIARVLKDSGVKIRSRGESQRWEPTDTQARKVIQLYKMGWSAPRIGKKVKRSLDVVLHFLRRKGVKIRNASEAATLRQAA